MRYVYLEITKRDGRVTTNPKIAKLERDICGVSQKTIAEVIGCNTPMISRWERTGRVSVTADFIAYRRIADGIHYHVSIGYRPCPTLIRIAPERWTIRQMRLLDRYRVET